MTTRFVQASTLGHSPGGGTLPAHQLASVGDRQLLFVSTHATITPAQPAGGWTLLSRTTSQHNGLSIFTRSVTSQDLNSSITVSYGDHGQFDLRTYSPCGVAVAQNGLGFTAPSRTNTGLLVRALGSSHANTGYQGSRTLTPDPGLVNAATCVYDWYGGLVIGDDPTSPQGQAPSRTTTFSGEGVDHPQWVDLQLDDGNEQAPTPIALNQVGEASQANPFAAGFGTLQAPLTQVVEANAANPVSAGIPALVVLGQAGEVGAGNTLTPMLSLVRSLNQAAEPQVATPLFPQVSYQVVPVQTVVETQTAGQVTAGYRVVPLDLAVELNLARPIPRSGQVAVAGSTQYVAAITNYGDPIIPGRLVLEIIDKSVEQAPTAIVVTVSEAIPDEQLIFRIDNVEVARVRANGNGTLAMTSIPVYEEQGAKGVHQLSVSQQGILGDTETFYIERKPNLKPTVRGDDLSPVFVRESLRSNGVRAWVLQDLMPGGLGSWVMPINPEEMDNPAFERSLSARHTTALDTGKFHVFEAGHVPLDWSFRGYAPTSQMHRMLRAFGDLKRRFYLHDHRGRAWIVSFTSVDLVPRVREQTIYGDLSDWVHDYTVTAVIYNQERPVQL